MHGEDPHVGLGQRLADAPCGLEAVQLRHGQIMDSDLRAVLERKLDSLAAVGSLSTDLSTDLLLRSATS